MTPLLDKLIADLSKLPGYELVTRDEHGLASTELFQVRWRPTDDWDYEVEFGVEETFDRWANSTNFMIKKSYCPDDSCTVDFVESYKWMEKVVKSGLFNFNSYFATIRVPFFSTITKGHPVKSGEKHYGSLPRS